jgi:hypothetical protein
VSGRAPLDALPPRSGYRRRSVRLPARVGDALLDARLARFAPRLDRLAETGPRRRVVALGIYRPESSDAMAAAVAEPRRTRHALEVRLGSTGAAIEALADDTRAETMKEGRLANMNRLAADVDAVDWVLLIDDDVSLPRGFLDRLVGLTEQLGLSLAQPALSLTSHTAFPLVRRRRAIARRTNFVEIGPVLMIRGDAFAELSPFPDEAMGWGVDLHWAAVASRLGWGLGVIDAVPIRHDTRPPAVDYDREATTAAAQDLLTAREHIGWREVRTLQTWRSL